MMKQAALATTGLALLIQAGPAWAQVDAQAFSNRLEEAAALQGISLSHQGAEAEGQEDVILRGLTMGEGQPPRDVRFETVTGSTKEGWNVARIPLEPVDTAQDGNNVSVNGAAIENFSIASPNSDRAQMPLFFERALVEEMSVSTPQAELFSLRNGRLNVERGDGGAIGTDFEVESFTANFEASEEPETRQIMTDLGYPTVTGSLSGAGEWDPVPGRLALEPLKITLEDAGEFSLAYEILGYTPSFITALQQLQTRMQAAPGSAQNMGMAYLGLLSQLSLASIEISYEDNSLAEKLIDYYAQQGGQTPEQYVESLEQSVAALAPLIEDETFRQTVTDAVSRFLGDSQSFRIAVAPTAPVPATQIVAAAMGAPQTLPNVLALEISANGEGGEAGEGESSAPQ